MLYRRTHLPSPPLRCKVKIFIFFLPPLVTHFFLLYRSYTLLTQSYINWTRKRIPSRMFSFFSFLEEKKNFFFSGEINPFHAVSLFLSLFVFFLFNLLCNWFADSSILIFLFPGYYISAIGKNTILLLLLLNIILIFFLKIFPFNFIWNKRIQKIYSPNPSPHLSSFVFYFNKSTWRRRINFQSFCLNLEYHKSFFFKTFFFLLKILSPIHKEKNENLFS